MLKAADPVFTVHVRVTGPLNSDFVFVDRNAYRRWRNHELKELHAEYPGLSVSTSKLEPVHVGGRCYVRGDGDRVYDVLFLHEYEPHRFGFLLSGGCCEGVHKCTPAL